MLSVQLQMTEVVHVVLFTHSSLPEQYMLKLTLAN